MLSEVHLIVQIHFNYDVCSVTLFVQKFFRPYHFFPLQFSLAVDIRSIFFHLHPDISCKTVNLSPKNDKALS